MEKKNKKTNEQVAKNDAVTIGLYIFIGLLLLILVILFIKNSNNIDKTSTLVTNLYKIISNENLSDCGGLTFYSNNEINLSNLSQDKKICRAVLELEPTKVSIKATDKTCKINDVEVRSNEKTNNCDLDFYSDEQLKAKYSTYFADTITKYDAFNLNTVTYCYHDDTRGGYICGEKIKSDINIDYLPSSYKYIENVEETNNIIKIYDKYLLVSNDKCYENNEINSNCTSDLQNEVNITENIIKKHGLEYVHTFESTDGVNYTWVSSKLK